MKNLIISSLFTFAFSLAALAVPSWASINTDAYKGKTGMDNVTSYSAYYCTTDAAKEMFDASTVSALTDYFKNNFDTGVSELQDGATALTDASWSSVASYYTFFANAAAPENVGYVGFALFAADDVQAFRIFGSGNPEIGEDYISFDAEGSDAGAWTTAVPEPTSALLLLLGVAGLCLRRKRACFHEWQFQNLHLGAARCRTYVGEASCLPKSKEVLKLPHEL